MPNTSFHSKLYLNVTFTSIQTLFISIKKITLKIEFYCNLLPFISFPQGMGVASRAQVASCIRALYLAGLTTSHLSSYMGQIQTDRLL